MNMIDNLRLPAFLMSLAVLIHLASSFLASVAADGQKEIVLAVLAAVAAAGLWLGWRAWAWLVLLGLVVAIGAAFARFGTSSVPDSLITVLLSVDICAACALFIALWRGRRMTQ